MSILERNIHTLLEVQPEIKSWIDEGLESLNKDEIFLEQAKHGWTLSVTTTTGKRYLYSKYHTEKTRADIQEFRGQGQNVGWIGLGLGYELMDWYKSHTTNQKILIVEQSLTCLVACLMVQDWTSMDFIHTIRISIPSRC